MRMWPLKSATQSESKSGASYSSIPRRRATGNWQIILESSTHSDRAVRKLKLTSLLVNRSDFSPIDFEAEINHEQPVYIVEPAKKNDAHLMLVSRTKKARWKYRSFNPDEDVRLSALEAIRHVAQSAGAVPPCMPSSTIVNFGTIPVPKQTTIIRDPAASNEDAWRQLWSDYNAFYETSVPEAVTARTWQRVLDPASAVFGRLAVAAVSMS